MLLQNEARDVTKSGVLESAKATIKTSPKIFNFFADQTYANKPRAICRELTANAVDSHVMAGKPNEPVEVWLPTLMDPVFKVRDFGLGMSHEFMMSNFMQYADGSTKDGSNVAIGGFGIGSKSPFAYVDQYTVKSTFDGTVSVYSVFKDEDGIPSIALLARKSTDESNGVEVSFPVQPEDFESFREAAFEALRYFKPLPLIRNAGQHRFEAPEYVSEGKNWGMRATAGPLQVVMGGVMYPVDANNLTYKFSDETARKMLTYGLDIYVPIGTCSIALSREALSYDDRTVSGLTQACLGVVDEVAKSFSTMFDHHPSEWDAQTALWDEVHPNNRSYGISTRGEFLAKHALYKGRELGTNISFLVPGGMSIWDLDPANFRRGQNKTPNPKWDHYSAQTLTITPGKFELVIIDDLPQSPKSKAIAKIKEVLAQQPQAKRIIVIRPFQDTTSVKTILNVLGNPSTFIQTSTLPDPSPAIMAGTKAPRPKVRMFTYNGYKGQHNWSGASYYASLNPGAYGRKGIAEIAYADQPDSGILVKMETWKPSPERFFDKMALGLVTWDELHFVNVGDAKKLDEKKWINFETVFEKRLAQKLKSVKGLGQQLAVEQKFDHEMKLAVRLKKLDKVDAKHPLKRLQKLYNDYVASIKEEHRKFGSFVKVALPNNVDPTGLWGEFKSSYPHAHRLLELTSFRPSGDDLEWFYEELK